MFECLNFSFIIHCWSFIVRSLLFHYDYDDGLEVVQHLLYAVCYFIMIMMMDWKWFSDNNKSWNHGSIIPEVP